MLRSWHALLLVAVVSACATARAQAAPAVAARAGGQNRSCAAGAIVMHQNLYGKTVEPMRTLNKRTISQCCEACQRDADCGAYFAKAAAGRADAIPTGSCALYNATEAAKLQRGQCPGTQPHICGSAIWVGSVSSSHNRCFCRGPTDSRLPPTRLALLLSLRRHRRRPRRRRRRPRLHPCQSRMSSS